MIVAVSAISLGSISSVKAELSDDAFLNSIPEVTYIVKGKKDEACEQAAHMKLQKVTAPRFLKNLQAWGQLCQRRTGILNSLLSGGDAGKIATIKKIIADSQVKEVAEME